MIKKGLMLGAITLLTGSAFSQTHDAIHKALNDPRRAEKEAKADVYIQRQPKIADTVQRASAANTKSAFKKKKTCTIKKHS